MSTMFSVNIIYALWLNSINFLSFREMAGASQTLRHEDVVSNLPRKASSHFYFKLLEE